MANLSVQIQGLNELVVAFNKSPQITGKEINIAISKTILLLLGEARKNTPVDTGFLRETGMQTTFGELIGVLENVAPYAVYVHDGTKFMEARPFFEIAIQSSESQVNDFFNQALENITNQLAK